MLWAMLALVTVAVAPVSNTMATAQFAGSEPDLQSDQRVYDQTGTSLTPDQVAKLERQIRDLEEVGANAIVVVRALDATPEETLEQVEALQQAWVAETGADQDTAVAILINRNPDDPNDARAGIYVGSTFDDGNVPREEQEAIVGEALIPPLRDGDVYGSLTAGLDRLESSIRYGPPQSAFEEWASDAASSWLVWANIGAAVAGLAGSLALFRQRQTTPQPKQPSTTIRPGNVTPALAGALATGSPQASAVPATLLELASRNALDFQPESEGGMFNKPKIQVRLVDRDAVSNDIEAVLWSELEKQAKGGVVPSKGLTKVARDSKAVREEVKSKMRDEGWIDPGATGNKTGLVVIGIVAMVLAIFSLVVTAIGEQWVPVVGVVALAAVAVVALILHGTYSGLSRTGQEAAIPWEAYREGLKRSAKDDAAALDLDAVLADAVAMNLGSALNDRLKAANESGETLRAFASPNGMNRGFQAGYFPWWIAFSSSVSTSTGSGAGAVSGGGAGGGGGAAGST